MTSKTVEDQHETGIKKILLERELECVRTVQQSPVPSDSFKVVEEEEITLTEEPSALAPLHDEEIQVAEEEKPEEVPFVFPTPSLRKMLPDRVRRIQEENAIHVIPETFRSDFDPSQIPRIATTIKSRYIDILADMTGCVKYKTSLAEFWFLDTLANLLRRAQAEDMGKHSQAVLIHWFCEWMKEMQHFDAADRERMIRRFEDNMLEAATFIGERNYIPKPEEVGVFYKSAEERDPLSPKSMPDTVLFEKIGYECSLTDLANIIHYIFDLFSTDYQYNLVRSVFCFTPDYIPIDTPFMIHYPKKMYSPLKPIVKPKEKGPKKPAEKPPKPKKKEIETEEYLALQELRMRDARELEERDVRYREMWNLRCHILPLIMAVTEDLFNKYWPPPPPPIPEEFNLNEPRRKASHHKKGK